MIASLKALLLNHIQLTHALRTTLAVAFSLFFYMLCPLPHSLWGPITVTIVLIQPHAGVIKQKGLQRVGGTLLGALLGLATVFFPPSLQPLIPLWILLWCFLLSLKSHGKNTYFFFLASMTLIIVAYQAGTDQSLSVALWRVTNIIIGSLIAMLFSVFFPIRAQYQWEQWFYHNLEDLRHLYQAHASVHIPNLKVLTRINTHVIERDIQMTRLLPSVQKEQPTHAGHYKAIMRIQRSIISLTEQLIETHWVTDTGRKKLLAQTELKNYQQQIVDVFSQLVQKKTVQSDLSNAYTIKNIAVNIPQSPDAFFLGPYGYLWLTRQLMQRLDDLIIQINMINDNPL